MSASTDALERELLQDLETVGDELADDSFGEELYRGLTNTKWRKPGSAEGHVAVSWRRAEAIVNALRAGHGQDPLTLAQTGNEGEISDRVREAMEAGGWTALPLDTSRNDEQHVSLPPSAPPGDQGERDAPVEDSHAWERQAHAEADDAQRRTRPARTLGGSAPDAGGQVDLGPDSGKPS